MVVKIIVWGNLQSLVWTSLGNLPCLNCRPFIKGLKLRIIKHKAKMITMAS